MSSSFVTVRVHRTYTDLSGTPATGGSPTFTLSTTITDGVSETLVPGAEIGTINPSGQLVGPDGALGVALVALDLTTTNAPISPDDAHYEVTGEPGQDQPWHLVVTAAMAPTVDLATLQPVVED